MEKYIITKGHSIIIKGVAIMLMVLYYGFTYSAWIIGGGST